MAFYHDQHLAWQQRVSKEIMAASRFQTHYPAFKSSTNKQLYQTNAFGSYPYRTQAQKSPLAAKANYLLSRPSTSGSLKPRSASLKHDHVSVKASEKYEPSVKPKVIRYKTVQAEDNERRSIKSVSLEEKLKVRAERVKEEEIEREEAEKLENEGEEVDQVNDLNDDELRDGLSYVSGLTTSSQRRYIEELEGLLRKEKLRRIQLEESLRKAMENN